MKNTIFIAAIALSYTSVSQAQVCNEINPVGAVFAREGGEMPAGTFRMTSGGYEVITIATSDKSYQPASLYYGKDEAYKAKVDAMVPDGKVPTAMNCFVVRTPDGYIMFDAGLPDSKGGLTLERLAALKIKPDDIRVIYLTHGHFDHIGGLLNEKGDAVYPSAKVYISSAELNAIGETGHLINKAYDGRLVTFEPGEILPGNVLSISAKGHTPGHTAYQLGNLLFVGDLMHGPSIQLANPDICAGYDADRAQSITSRNILLNYAATNSLTIIGAHIPGNGVIF